MNSQEICNIIKDKTLQDAVMKVVTRPRSKKDGYKVYWNLLDSERNVISTRNWQCWSGLTSELYSHREKVKYIKTWMPRPKIDREKGVKFLRLCKKYGMLPVSTRARKIFKDGIEIDITKKFWSASRLYIALCSYRYIRDDIDFAESVVDLVDAGAAFFNAFYFCHGQFIHNSGHSWLPFNGGVYKTGDSYRKSIDAFKLMVKLVSSKSVPKDSHVISGQKYFDVINEISKKLQGKVRKDLPSPVSILCPSLRDAYKLTKPKVLKAVKEL